VSRRDAGFTLLEMLVALGILGVMTAIVSASLRGAADVQAAADRRTELVHTARTAVDRVAQDAVSAFVRSVAGAGTTRVDFLLDDRELEGVARDRLTFATFARPLGGAADRAGDTALVEYELAVSDDRRQWVLLRRQSPRLDLEALARAPADIVAERVVGFDVQVYDGQEWKKEWRQPAKLPLAVGITVRVAPEPPPDARRPWGDGPPDEARLQVYGTRFVLPLARAGS
jgi:general secretion pathway protein J